MNLYKKTRTTLFFLLLSPIGYICAQSEYSDQLDLMIDFAYPVSMIESVRQDLNQALYFARQNDFQSVVSLLQDALAKFTSRATISDDDIAYIENLIHQIDAIMQSLENNDQRAIIVDLCQQLEGRL